ncbi:Na+/H+ antiporter subunit E [Pseudoruegeria sp. SK021]|uniref:Na+/H+ antiporter subunit E n=1 Tax=Pseudoruegeria sp. SK021 TaxID=1933035 RepID=UPI000A24EE1F|nr:Na+/H+ antiporter subunit E [Pseudoruegeria sp. SK021]OSP56825.1 sodium:proton antiporter [Pseudoruegeria sp. SK021]
MTLFAINILLAGVWAALSATFTFNALISGFLIGYGALWLAAPLFGESRIYFVRVVRIVQLILFFSYDLMMSSLRVAYSVLTPRDLSKPQILEMPLDAQSDLEILLVTNLISLTPGTLSLDVSEDRKTLYVHAMFAQDPDQVIRDLKSGMEHMVLRVFES